MTKEPPTPDPALTAALRPDPSRIDELTTTLADRADAEGLLEVAYRRVDGPYGTLLVAATEVGIVRLTFADRPVDEVLEELAREIGPRILESPRRTDEAARQLTEYFEGTRRDFDLPIDRRLSRGFRALVVAHLSEIAYGRTETYGEVAAALGNPGAVRAVGTACATNPIPVIVPCHRVVRSDGTIGNYLGGTEMKRALLAMETGGPAQGRIW